MPERCPFGSENLETVPERARTVQTVPERFSRGLSIFSPSMLDRRPASPRCLPPPRFTPRHICKREVVLQASSCAFSKYLCPDGHGWPGSGRFDTYLLERARTRSLRRIRCLTPGAWATWRRWCLSEDAWAPTHVLSLLHRRYDILRCRLYMHNFSVGLRLPCSRKRCNSRKVRQHLRRGFYCGSPMYSF